MPIEVKKPVTVGEFSIWARLVVPNSPLKDPQVVSEIFAAEAVTALRGRIPFTDLTHVFIEKWRKKEGGIGFGVYGREMLISDYFSMNLDGTLDETVLKAGEEREDRRMRQLLRVHTDYVGSYTGRFPYSPPIAEYDFTVTMPISKLELKPEEVEAKVKTMSELVEHLTGGATEAQVEKDYFGQFRGEFVREDFGEELIEALKRDDDFSLGEGRYVQVVSQRPDEHLVLNHGHVISASRIGVTVTDFRGANSWSYSTPVDSQDVRAIFGKRSEVLFRAKAKEPSGDPPDKGIDFKFSI